MTLTITGRLRIGLLAPPVEPVPPSAYGGTERVIAMLADALVARGHDVTLFASGDSRTSARLVPTVERAIWHDDRFADPLPFWTLAVGHAYAQADRLEIMHNHADHFALAAARTARIPTVSTLHGRLDFPELRPLYEEFGEHPLVSISLAQRRPLPAANWIANIPHGLPADLYRPSYGRGRHLAFCGRFSPEKGIEGAIALAQRSGIPLRIAARYPRRDRVEPYLRAEWDYYHEVVAPIMRADPLVEYVGEISEAEKQELYGGAMALLFPVDWPEPFGLVMIEALACATPVLARPRGSVLEVIRDGVTGYHCETLEDFQSALERIERIERRACRDEFESRFTAEVMAAAYEGAYARLLGRGPLGAPRREPEVKDEPDLAGTAVA